MYEALGCAIAMQAVEDYRTAHRELQLAIAEHNTRKIHTRILRMADARRFFESGYCEFLTGVKGRIFLDNMDKITIPTDYAVAFQPLDKDEESEVEND